MANKSLGKAMILVMELIILEIFNAQANVLAPPSLCPASVLPIRLLQVSQNGNDHRHHCIESTIEKCKYIPTVIKMSRCVLTNFVTCIDAIVRRKGSFSRLWFDVKAILASLKCEALCFRGKKVVEPHHGSCLVYCPELLI
jgi:hypothetical protein